MNLNRSLTVTWEDPLAAFEEGKKLPPIDYMRAVRDGRIPAPPIACLLGMRLVDVGEGEAAFELTPAEQHYNPIGVVHGGIAFTMLDSAMGCAVHTTLAPGKGYTTLEIKANLVRPITLQTGPIRARGKVVHLGRQTATAEARLEDASGKLYAHGSTTCIILG
ncbi:MAG TPA: PaaI family thioesterase [Burkholderiales bacterium]|nr:PaaI family thioesterase [Burkholderiales bacterium]